MLRRRSPSSAVVKTLLVLTSQLPALHSRSLVGLPGHIHDFPEEDPGSPVFWWKLAISLVLVLLGGVFAGADPEGKADVGLTLALLSQDEITVGGQCVLSL
jgi:hypothetical protein